MAVKRAPPNGGPGRDARAGVHLVWAPPAAGCGRRGGRPAGRPRVAAMLCACAGGGPDSAGRRQGRRPCSGRAAGGGPGSAGPGRGRRPCSGRARRVAAEARRDQASVAAHALAEPRRVAARARRDQARVAAHALAKPRRVWPGSAGPGQGRRPCSGCAGWRPTPGRTTPASAPMPTPRGAGSLARPGRHRCESWQRRATPGIRPHIGGPPLAPNASAVRGSGTRPRPGHVLAVAQCGPGPGVRPRIVPGSGVGAGCHPGRWQRQPGGGRRCRPCVEANFGASGAVFGLPRGRLMRATPGTRRP